MNRAIARLILLLVVAAGCETEKDPVDEPLDPSLHLTDGFCLVRNSRVALNHYDIDYYDYSAHLIYLKNPAAFETELTDLGGAVKVYADSSRIYDLYFYAHIASHIVEGPVIMVDQIFYPDYTVAIQNYWSSEQMAKEGDPRQDPRIREALEKYGQFRHGLQCKITSVRQSAPGEVELKLELWNEDSLDYYYWDPEKLGMERYHYVSNGLSLVDENGQRYRHHIQSLSWDGTARERLSLLERDSSVALTLNYEVFDTLSPGTYDAFFKFPAMHYDMAREDLDLEKGRIWMGELQLYKEVVIN